MDDAAQRRADRKRIRFRNGMRHIDEIDGEGAELQPRAGLRYIYRDVRRARFAEAARFKQGGGERRGVKRNVEFRPKVDQRAHMVFVSMRQHQTDEVLSLLDEIADVRQDEVDTRQMLLGGKGNAAVDDQPRPLSAVAETVDRKVHSDFADAAERGKYQFWIRHHSIRAVAETRSATAPTTGNSSPAAIVCSGPSPSRSINQPLSSSLSYRPVSSPPGTRTIIPPPSKAARSSQSARTRSNAAPR